MQIIAGQNVSPNSMPGPTGFGFGSGHNPNAAAVMMNSSGVAPTTSKTRPTLTHVDLRYWLMADCGLTPRLSGRPETPDWSRGCRLSSRTRGDTTELHGPLQAVVRGTCVAAHRRHLSCSAQRLRAHARSSGVERSAEPIFSIAPDQVPLTVKLRGRTEAPDWSRGCTLSSRTRGDTTESHGPLQRWLDGGAKLQQPERPRRPASRPRLKQHRIRTTRRRKPRLL